MTGGWWTGGLTRTGAISAGSTPNRRFIGGMRLGRIGASFNATWPLAVLELHANGLRLAPSVRVFAGLPTWEALYVELTEVRAVGKIPLLTTGIRFRVGLADNEWAIFWSFRRRWPLEALAEQGIRVRRDPDRVNYWNPGRTAGDG